MFRSWSGTRQQFEDDMIAKKVGTVEKTAKVVKQMEKLSKPKVVRGRRAPKSVGPSKKARG